MGRKIVGAFLLLCGLSLSSCNLGTIETKDIPPPRYDYARQASDGSSIHRMLDKDGVMYFFEGSGPVLYRKIGTLSASQFDDFMSVFTAMYNQAARSCDGGDLDEDGMQSSVIYTNETLSTTNWVVCPYADTYITDVRDKFLELFPK